MSAGDWKGMLQAIYDGDAEAVHHFLRDGVDPNYEHPEMLCTPLIEAVRADKEEIVTLLLKYGADPFRVSSYAGRSAYNEARTLNKTAMVKLFPRPNLRQRWKSLFS